MQPVFVLVLLMLMQQQPDLGASMQKFLAFYRENRALISALMGETVTNGTAGAPSAMDGAPAGSPAPPHEKNRPAEGGFESGVLEEFLKNAAAH